MDLQLTRAQTATGRTGLAAALAAAATLLVALPAGADLFSPGELSQPHASLEGLKNCTKCHVAGKQLSGTACLACHTELKARVADGKGFHGRLAPEKRAECEQCHHDHQGREFEMVEWGEAGQKKFDHRDTGFVLAGAHPKVDCAKCHEPRRVRDDAVRKLLLQNPKRETFLGLGTRCLDCHFDEHRGAVATDCQKCHGEAAWKPAAAFDHARTDYPLEGRHRKVDCEKCHARQEDAATPADAFPPPVARTFAKFGGVDHARCTDCHKDPHENRFGQACASCHSPEDWKLIKGQGAERTFHDKTKFPLRGAHVEVVCAGCHGQPMKTKGLAFERCADCHADAHEGQLGARGEGAECDRCHTVEAFAPARFGVEEHRRTTYPLEGRHAAVACQLCHVKDPSLAERVPAAVRAGWHKARRKALVSLAVFDLPKAGKGCESCHADAHLGQLEPKGRVPACARCHAVDGFSPARFEADDHDKTRFHLDGAHRAVACNLCHVDDARLLAKAPPALRAGLRRAGKAPARDGRELLVSVAVMHPSPVVHGCQGCHEDVHAGQFATRVGKDGCEGCHRTTSFQDLSFDHAKDSRYPLTGAHLKAACAGCHPPTKVDGRAPVRYRPVETACASCHADVHLGQFAPRPGAPTDCARCHPTASFEQTTFQHAPPFTDFALLGRHQQASCTACHPQVTLATGARTRRYKPLPHTCEECHVDQHQGAFAGFQP